MKVNTLLTVVQVRLDRVEVTQRLVPGLYFRQPFSLFFEAPLDVLLLDEVAADRIGDMVVARVAAEQHDL